MVLLLDFFFKILLDRSILYFVYFDKIPIFLMENRCFLQKPLPASHSRFPSGNFDGCFKPLTPLGFVPWAEFASPISIPKGERGMGVPFPAFSGCQCGGKKKIQGLCLSCIPVIYPILFEFPGVSLAIDWLIDLLAQRCAELMLLGGDTSVQEGKGWQKVTFTAQPRVGRWKYLFPAIPCLL